MVWEKNHLQLLTSDHPEEEFLELLPELIAISERHGVVLSPQEEFHLSLSQTVVLRHHWIQPFTQSLKKGLLNCRRFVTRLIAVPEIMQLTVMPVLFSHCYTLFWFSVFSILIITVFIHLFARFVCTADRLKVYCNAERTRCSTTALIVNLPFVRYLTVSS